jgi:predicted nucleic acid-binding protein
MVVFDTTVLVEYTKGNPKTIETVNQYTDLHPDGIATTFITEYELLRYQGRDGRRVDREMLSRFKIYQSTDEAASISADIFIELKSKGKMINENDILIAGICKANGEKLITYDKDFSRISAFDVDVLER